MRVGHGLACSSVTMVWERGRTTMSPSLLRCSSCGVALQPDDHHCTACGTPASGAWVTWQAPLPSPPSTMDRLGHDEAAADFQPLHVPPDNSRRDRVTRLTIALLITLLSGMLLALAELLLRDGYDKLSWGIVWFASLGVLVIAVLGWCIAGTRKLRRRVRRWRRSR